MSILNADGPAMKIPFFVKSLLVGVPVGVTFLDCVGYIARVDGRGRRWYWPWNSGICYLTCLLIRAGISMQPALNPDTRESSDYVFLSRWAVHNYSVERGDIVSLISPKDPDQKIIKRVVGFQGDVVATLGYKKPFVRIPEGHCWVEGDHTGNNRRLNVNIYILVLIFLCTSA